MIQFPRIIFIHQPHIGKGGLQLIDKRNIYVLSQFTKELITVELSPYNPKATNNFCIKLYNRLRMFLTKNVDCKAILENLQTEKENSLIFISHSLFGFYASNLRKKYNVNSKIVVFFHNVERDYHRNNLRQVKSYSNLQSYLLACLSEREVVQNSDFIIALNERDKALLVERYGDLNIGLLPTSFESRTIQRKFLKNERLKLLFVGTYFLSNKDGVEWLANNIAPYVNVDIYIVGSGMDKMKKQLSLFSNIHVFGEVSEAELEHYYLEADLFISTLFFGGGMKTKVAEAMMYGLPIIGTTETFQGYNFDISAIGLKSNSPQEIIDFIERVDNNRDLLEVYSKQAREIFVSDYSFDSSVMRMEAILESLNK